MMVDKDEARDLWFSFLEQLRDCLHWEEGKKRGANKGKKLKVDKKEIKQDKEEEKQEEKEDGLQPRVLSIDEWKVGNISLSKGNACVLHAAPSIVKNSSVDKCDDNESVKSVTRLFAYGTYGNRQGLKVDSDGPYTLSFDF